MRSLSAMQACNIRQHSGTDVHKMAVLAYHRPQANVVEIVTTAMDDLKLLRGGVPQLPDLVRLWAWLQKPVSFTVMESFSLSESFLQHARADISRRAAAAMVKGSENTRYRHSLRRPAFAS